MAKKVKAAKMKMKMKMKKNKSCYIRIMYNMIIFEL